MSATLQSAKPKVLAAGEGEAHAMLTHTIVWKATSQDTNGHYALFEMSDTADGSAPLHSHPWEETFYMLEGELEVQVGDRLEILTAGAVCHVPANTVHGFRVCSPSARALGVISPGTAEAFYREMGETITSLPPDPIALANLCGKYNVPLQ